MANDLAGGNIDLDQPTAAELTGEDRVFAVDREIRVVDSGALRRRQRLLNCHLLRIAEIELLQALRNNDRGTAVRRKVEVVRIFDRDRRAGFAGLRIDRSEAALVAATPVIVDPQCP